VLDLRNQTPIAYGDVVKVNTLDTIWDEVFVDTV